jgi:adenylosuccinate lyase
MNDDRMNNIFHGLVVYPKIIEKHIEQELPFMATENISTSFKKIYCIDMHTNNTVVMACVDKGLSRQDAHEEIRVLSHQASDVVKNQGKSNDLIERIKKTKFFEPILDQMDALLKPETFIGRAPQQVEKFLKVEVRPAIQKYDAQIKKSGSAELSV